MEEKNKITFFGLFIFCTLFVNSINGDQQSVVINCGDKICEAGFDGDPAPRGSFPTVVGRLKVHTAAQKQTFVGNEINGIKPTLNLSYPIKNGVVQNWDDFEVILHYIFYDVLHTEPEERKVLISDSPSHTSESRQKTVQVLFDTYNVAGVYVADTNLLKSYANNNAWLGGSNLAATASFQDKWITSDDYAENGPAVVDSERSP